MGERQLPGRGRARACAGVKLLVQVSGSAMPGWCWMAVGLEMDWTGTGTGNGILWILDRKGWDLLFWRLGFFMGWAGTGVFRAVQRFSRVHGIRYNGFNGSNTIATHFP